MRVLVAMEDRFVEAQNGNVYSDIVDYSFLSRYLTRFDHVTVFARMVKVEQVELHKPHANGRNVSFVPVPMHIGLWQYLIHWQKLNALAKRALTLSDAFILRVPGALATHLWRQLIKNNVSYGIEAIGDPWDVLAPGNVRSTLRPILRLKLRRDMQRQCHLASAVSYQTKSTLQQRYPPGGWSTHFSDVDLPVELIADEKTLSERFESLGKSIEGQRPFRICHAGTMDALYKGQDTLIEAVSLCCKRGLRVKLNLLGDGRYFRYFVNKAKHFGIYQNMEFLGMLPRGVAVMNQFDATDMFVLPSTTEGLPRALIEAMARGLPCIGTNVGGVPELLTPNEMVAPRNAKALAAKIETAIYDKDWLKRMSRRNVKIARRYSVDELSRRRIEFYEKVIEAQTDILLRR